MLSVTRCVFIQEKYVDFNDLDKVVGDGAFVMIQPEKRKTDDVSALWRQYVANNIFDFTFMNANVSFFKVYDQLLQASVRGLNVYKRDKLPKKLHLRDSEMVLPIVLTADEGYVINTVS